MCFYFTLLVWVNVIRETEKAPKLRLGTKNKSASEF